MLDDWMISRPMSLIYCGSVVSGITLAIYGIQRDGRRAASIWGLLLNAAFATFYTTILLLIHFLARGSSGDILWLP
jgi:hypothetical protein